MGQFTRIPLISYNLMEKKMLSGSQSKWSVSETCCEAVLRAHTAGPPESVK